jgi:hypothetical protein
LLSADITKVKIGYVAAVQYLFEEGEKTHFAYNKHQMLAEALARVFINKNKRLRKPEYSRNELFSNLIEMNKMDFYYFMNPTISPLDNIYIYALVGSKLKNSNDKIANGLAMSSHYKPRKNFAQLKRYYENLYAQSIIDALIDILEHDKTAQAIHSHIKNDVLRTVNPEHYIDNKTGKIASSNIDDAAREIDVISDKILKSLTHKE